MSSISDWSNPIVQVEIVTADERIFPLWVNGAAQGVHNRGGFQGSEEGLSELKSLAFLQEVNVDWGLSYVPVMTATLAPPFRDAVAFLDSELIEWGRSRLRISLGYPGNFSPQFVGLLLKPEVSLGVECNIQLNAQGFGAWALTAQEAKENSNDETRKQIIERLAKGPLGKRDITVDFEEVKNDSIAQKKLNAPQIGRAFGARTYWDQMYTLANEAECDLVADADGLKIRVVSQNSALMRAPRRVFRMFDFAQGRLGDASEDPNIAGGTKTEGGVVVYPIFSVSSPMSEIYLPADDKPTSYTMAMNEIPEKTRKPAEPKLICDPNITKTNTGKGKWRPRDSPDEDEIEPVEMAEFLPGDPEDESDYGTVVSSYKREGNAGIQLDIESIGIPDITPGETVVMEGIGKYLGGHRWFVTKVQHTAGLSGFSTNLSVISNVDLQQRTGFEAHGPANTHELIAGGGDVRKETVPQNLG